MPSDKQYTVLLIDDSADDRATYCRYLQHGSAQAYHILEAGSAAAGLAFYQRSLPDVILLEYFLPDMDGLECLTVLRQQKEQQHVPVLMLTGQGHETIAVQALKKGAQDYLIKGNLTAEGLCRAIHHAIEQCQLQQRLQQQQQMLVTITLGIQQSLQLEAILQTTITEVRQVLNVDRVVVYQFQPDMSGTIIIESVLPGWKVALGSQIQDTCFQHNPDYDDRAGKNRAIDNIYEAGFTACHVQLLEQFEVKANLTAPIIVEGKLWGLLIAHQCSASRQWQATELDLLDQLVVQIAIAVQQATAYQQAQAELAKRERIEAILRESEQRYATLTEISPVGIFQTDAAGNCLYVNERWCHMAGLTPAEAAGFGWVKAIHPEDRDVVSAEWYAAVQSNRPFRLEYRFQKSAGQVTYALGQAVAERSATGEIVGYVGTITDISEQQAALRERNAAEQALEIQRDFNQLIAEITSRFVDLSPNDLDAEIERALYLISEIIQADTSYLFTFDDDQGTVRMTHEWCKPDYPRQIALAQAIPQAECPWSNALLKQREIVHVPCMAAAPPEAAIDQAIWQQFDLTALLMVPLIQKSVVTGLMGFASFSGDSTWEEETIRLLRVMGQTIANVQERTQNEQRLSISEERLRLALGATKQGLYDLNLQTGEAIVTPEYATMLGYDPATFQETNAKWIERLHPNERAFVVSTYQAYVAGNIPDYKIEFRQRTQTGAWKWILSVGKVVGWDATGQPLRLLGTHTDISDRKRAEVAQSQLAAIVESSVDAIISQTLAGVIVSWNKGAENLFGYTAAEAIGQSLLLLDPAGFEHEEAAILKRLKRGSPLEHYETVRQHKDGRFIDVSLTISPIKDVTGTIIGASKIVRDISDRKQAEADRLQTAQVRKELKLLENIFDIILAGYWDWDIPNNQEYLSPGLKRMFGYGDDELPNTPESLQRLLFAEDLPSVLDCFDRHVQSHGTVPYYNEVRYHHKDGSTIWVICSGQVIEWDSAGKPLRMIGCHIDITDRKQAEDALRNLSDRLALALKSGAIAIWDWNITEDILTWDDRMHELYGIRSDQFTSVYEAWASSLHPDDRPHAEAAIQRALAGEKDYDPEFRVVHPDGMIRFLRAYALVQRNEQGEPQWMIGINFDITEAKQAETKLLQTTVQLEASNKELEAFAYSVSHDLRSPLRAIDGFSRALLEDYGDQFGDEGNIYFDRIRHNVNRMGLLIDDLLRLSRVSRSEMQYSVVNLSLLVQEQIHELQAMEPDRQVTVVVAPRAIVSADATLMRVVINNLLQNAWKFTSHHDTARIEFGILQQAGQLTYFVRDDGAGFDMAYAKMLFGVFQRLHNTHEFPGTGIGLATVQRAIHRHGGKVWAEGAVEQGATIAFTVPHLSIHRET